MATKKTATTPKKKNTKTAIEETVQEIVQEVKQEATEDVATFTIDKWHVAAAAVIFTAVLLVFIL